MSVADLNSVRPATLRFAAGDARYVGDIQPGAPAARRVRAQHRTARQLLGVDIEHVGTAHVVTGAELLDRTEPQPVIWDLPGQQRSHTRSLAHDVVRYVGEPVAVVVAETLAAARAAAARVVVRYRPLAAVATTTPRWRTAPCGCTRTGPTTSPPGRYGTWAMSMPPAPARRW